MPSYGEELRAKRANLHTQALEIHKRATDEKRSMTGEEQDNYDKYMGEIHGLMDDIKDWERREKEQKDLAAEINASRGRQSAPDNFRGADPTEEKPDDIENRVDSKMIEIIPGLSQRADLVEMEMRALQNFLAYGEIPSIGSLRVSPEQERELRQQTQQVGISKYGGALVAPMKFVADLIIALDERVFIRSKATKHTLENAASMGAPALSNDFDDAEWTSELSQGAQDDLEFGGRELNPHPLGKRVIVSNTLLRIGALNVENIIQARLLNIFAVTEEKAFLTGNGAQQPLGVFTPSNDGISTDRDFKNGNDTEVQADAVKGFKYNLSPAYRPNSEWLCHTDFISAVSTIKDGVDQYLWRMGLADNDPDRIGGRPVNESVYAPNTFEADEYVAILGDFSEYWIADSLMMTVQRLIELYALQNSIGYIARKETDGMPVQELAYARFQMGS